MIRLYQLQLDREVVDSMFISKLTETEEKEVQMYLERHSRRFRDPAFLQLVYEAKPLVAVLFAQKHISMFSCDCADDTDCEVHHNALRFAGFLVWLSRLVDGNASSKNRA